MRRAWHRIALSLLVGALLAGCNSSASTSTPTGPAKTATTAAPVEQPLRILVTNDDGVGAAGIDAVVEGLRRLPDTEVTVVAPATNQSGTAGKTTNGLLTVKDANTASGYAAKAVTGFPADTIVWAIDQHGVEERPHLVVSGINTGQNIGPLSAISGTVGAARAAASRGIPALAASQGLAKTLDFPSGVKLVSDWVTEHRAELLAAQPPPPGASARPAELVSINIPTCVTGSLRELVEVRTATDIAGRNIGESDCESPAIAPKDDIDAFIHGYPSLSTLETTPG